MRSVDDRRREPPVERRRDRELVAGRDVERVRQRAGTRIAAGVVAQELVDRRQLAADAGGLAAGLLGAALGLADRAAAGLGATVAVARGSSAVATSARAAIRSPAASSSFELGQLPGQLGLAIALQRLELGLERLDPRRRLGISRSAAVARSVSTPRGAPAAGRRGRRVASIDSVR